MRGYLFVAAVLCAQSIAAQENKIDLNIGAASTEAQTTALAIGLKLFDSFQANLDSEMVAAGDNWYMYLIPQLDIKYGSGDVFNGFILKGTGVFMFYKNITIDGVQTDDDSKLKWVLPYSGGVETNKDFKNFNVLAEIGLIPSYKAMAREVNSKLVKKLCNYTNFGIYFQGGNKVGNPGDSDSLAASVGDASLTKETIGNGIARLKLRGNIAPLLLRATKGDFNVHIKAEGTYWYDFINKVNYYRVEAKLGVQVTKNFGFDFGYEKGSGAPNFNTGDQYGGSLTIKL